MASNRRGLGRVRKNQYCSAFQAKNCLFCHASRSNLLYKALKRSLKSCMEGGKRIAALFKAKKRPLVSRFA
jgi:hypothetical protein